MACKINATKYRHQCSHKIYVAILFKQISKQTKKIFLNTKHTPVILLQYKTWDFKKSIES